MELVEQGGRVLLKVAGPVRLGEVDSLHELCLAASETGLDVTLSLEAAEHLHAAALQSLRALQRHVESNGRAFIVVEASEAARASLALSGLSHWLPPTSEQD